MLHDKVLYKFTLPYFTLLSHTPAENLRILTCTFCEADMRNGLQQVATYRFQISQTTENFTDIIQILTGAEVSTEKLCPEVV